MLKIKVEPPDAGKRADVFLAEKLPKFTRSSLSGLFENALVVVNNKPARGSYRLKGGDKLEVDTRLLTARPADIKLPIVYEDDDVIVINKPAGILTHSKGVLNTEATVASFIEPKLNDKRLTGNRAGIVHRLDRATSGVIITAKNEKALKQLQKQFSTRKVKKIYRAIVEGTVEPAEAIIDASIERNPKKPQTFRVSSNGRSAITNYQVLKTLNKPAPHQVLSEKRGNTSISSVKSLVTGSNNSYSLLELTPQTGRTHQLRVHLKYIGHPIVGDRVYGHDGENLYLHAKSLELTLPSGQKMKFEAPAPKVFKEFISS
ncbi:hypothetical protein BVY00_01785 [bacterium G20]|nr:hypothetical protein BVY00_01785 [bacterium G20]